MREETRTRHIGYSFRLAARVLLYAPSHIQDSIYHGHCYTSRVALGGTRNIFISVSMGKTSSSSVQDCIYDPDISVNKNALIVYT